MLQVISCALRSRANGDWYYSPHTQHLEINKGDVSMLISSVAKDFLIYIEYI